MIQRYGRNMPMDFAQNLLNNRLERHYVNMNEDIDV